MKVFSIFGLSESNFIIVFIFSLLVLLGLIYLYLSFVFVDKNHVKIVERNGKFRITLSSGWHFIIPFIDKIVAEMDTSIQAIFCEHEFSVATSDGKTYKANYFVVYKIVDFQKYYYSGSDVNRLLEAAITSELIKYYSNRSFDHYSSFFSIEKNEILELLSGVKNQFGIELIDYSLSNFYLVNI